MSASISKFDNIDVKTFITRIKKRQKSVFVKQTKKQKLSIKLNTRHCGQGSTKTVNIVVD